MRILVRRIGAFGDVVLTTPILRRLRRENPDAEIGIQSAYPGVFARSPHRLMLVPPEGAPYPWTIAGGIDRLIDLDLAYERLPHLHIVQAYMQVAFNEVPYAWTPEDWTQELFFDKPEPWPTERRVVAVHAAKAGWRNRTLPEDTWVQVTRMLRDAGCFPILIGSMRDQLVKAKCAAFHSTDVLAQAAMIARAACFIGSDSALLHIAGATETPIVGIFTCAAPWSRLPWRHSKCGWNAIAVQPALDCLGCLHRQPIPTTRETCERGDVACVGAVRARDIVDAALKLMNP